MADRTINLNDFAKMFNQKTFVETQKKKVIDSTYKALQKSKEDMKEISPKQTGEFSESWKTKKVGKNEVRFGNVSKHAHFVEYGTETQEPQHILKKGIKDVLIPNIEKQYKKDFK